MSDNSRIEVAFAIAQEFATIETFVAASSEICSGAHRLDGEYYGDSGYRAKRDMTRAGFPTRKIGDLATVFWPATCGGYSAFRRVYVDDTSYGKMFLSTSDMLLARFDDVPYVSTRFTPPVIRVKPKTILMSRSGTIGNTVVANIEFEDAFVSDDALQITPHDDDSRGMLYAFFLSRAGQFLVTRSRSGGVVEHIYERDLISLDVPFVPKPLRLEITRLIDESCDLRAKANRLIDEAVADVQHQCYLPDIGDFQDSHVSEDQPITFVHSANKRLFDDGLDYGERRLDATYHEPAAVAVAKYIFSHGRGHRLGDLLVAVRNSTLRKRNYVDSPELGVALIGGKQLMQWRPHGLK